MVCLCPLTSHRSSTTLTIFLRCVLYLYYWYLSLLSCGTSPRFPDVHSSLRIWQPGYDHSLWLNSSTLGLLTSLPLSHSLFHLFFPICSHGLCLSHMYIHLHQILLVACPLGTYLPHFCFNGSWTYLVSYPVSQATSLRWSSRHKNVQRVSREECWILSVPVFGFAPVRMTHMVLLQSSRSSEQ